MGIIRFPRFEMHWTTAFVKYIERNEIYLNVLRITFLIVDVNDRHNKNDTFESTPMIGSFENWYEQATDESSYNKG